nr:MAG: replication associated protein [Virus sp.]
MNRTSTSTSSGNTKAGACTTNKRSRKFFVTFWQKKDFLFDESTMVYACMCDDQCSEEHENKWHGHYYVYYKNPRTWKQLKQYFGDNAHIEIPKSNSGCIDYIMGRGEHANSKSNMQEMGKMPCDNGKHISVKQALEMTDDELMCLEDHKDLISIQKVRDMMDPGIKLSDWHKEIKVTFICGPSGVGKSTKARELLMEEGYLYAHEVKYESTFYHGTGNGKGAAIYDDFRDSHMRASEFINFIDYNTHIMNVKGGSVRNHYERIIITSVQHPEDLYRNMDDEPRKQWLRRIEIIDLTPERKSVYDICM